MKATFSLLAVLLASFAAHAAELRVSAAASLAETMEEVSAGWAKTSGEKLVLNFGGSNALARQIEAGAPCDVLFSADEATVAKLLEKDLLHANSVSKLLGNRLVVIAPSTSKLEATSAKDFLSPAIRRISIGDPAAVPAGVYARRWLESLGLWDQISPKTIAAENVRAALAATASGNVEAGIVYRTDALISKDVRIVFEVPSNESPEVIYPAAATKSSSDPGKAIRFIQFLRGETAAAIFRKHGFIPLSEPAPK